VPAFAFHRPQAEDLYKRLQRLAKDNKGSSVFLAVSDEVTGFKEAVPLIATLKNPAMKDRHWEKISALTGVKLPGMGGGASGGAGAGKSFTLGAVFAMNLHKYTEAVNEVRNEPASTSVCAASQCCPDADTVPS